MRGFKNILFEDQFDRLRNDDDFVINAFRRQGCPHQGRGMVLLSLHAMGFNFEISEDTMSGRVQREEATINKSIYD